MAAFYCDIHADKGLKGWWVNVTGAMLACKACKTEAQWGHIPTSHDLEQERADNDKVLRWLEGRA